MDLDTELDSLRNKLSEVFSVSYVYYLCFCISYFIRKYIFQVRKENFVLNQELQALERQTASSNSQVNYFNEALQLYEQNSVNEMFQGN